MPGIKKNMDGVKLSDTIIGEINPQKVCMSPTPPPKSDFKPTEKTQSGEFSQQDRELPQFRISSESDDLSLKIGARNPYAMINAKLLRKKIAVIQFEGMSASSCQQILQQNISSMTKEVSLTYKKLFDPAYNSQLFSYTKGRDTVVSNRPILSGHNDGDSVHTAAARGSCTSAQTWIPTTVPWSASATLQFDAPVQGNGLDCWLISAMCSITWVTPSFFQPSYTNGIFVLKDPTPPITQAELDAAWVYPDAKMPLPSGSSANSTAFWWTKSKYSELWPAMIEKAFAKQHLGTNTPNLCSIGKGDPQYALIVLKGNLNALRYWNKTANGAGAATTWNKENSTIAINPDGIWNNVLKPACTHPSAGNAFQKTKYPTVAFTYDSGDPDITHQTVANAAPQGSGVDYNSDLLVACHSYSLLGIYQKASTVTPNPNPKYVVLRNPWGLITSATRGQAQALQLTTDNLPKFTGSSPNWVDLVLWDSTASTGKLKDGIFALEHTKFCKYFRGFSWV
jgi:hypothetical protein